MLKFVVVVTGRCPGLGVVLIAGSGVTTSDWNMDSVLLAHSAGGVPDGTGVIFGGKSLVILDVDECVRAETRFYTGSQE